MKEPVCSYPKQHLEVSKSFIGGCPVLVVAKVTLWEVNDGDFYSGTHKHIQQLKEISYQTITRYGRISDA